MDSILQEEITSQLQKLNSGQRQQVLAFARSLTAKKPDGVPGNELLQFAGTIGPRDLELMERAIKEACEQVNPDEW